MEKEEKKKNQNYLYNFVDLAMKKGKINQQSHLHGIKNTLGSTSVNSEVIYSSHEELDRVSKELENTISHSNYKTNIQKVLLENNESNIIRVESGDEIDLFFPIEELLSLGMYKGFLYAQKEEIVVDSMHSILDFKIAKIDNAIDHVINTIIENIDTNSLGFYHLNTFTIDNSKNKNKKSDKMIMAALGVAIVIMFLIAFLPFLL